MPTHDTPFTRGPLASVLWGAFLGCSWTWIIGMVFPALLLRDYGLWGWVVFAVPNVAGAAAMGVVLYKPERSATIVRDHAQACHWFTIITVAYHLFVIAWLFSQLFGAVAVPMIVVAIGLCVALGRQHKHGAMLFVAAGVAMLSWGCFGYAQGLDGAWAFASFIQPDGEATRLGMVDLLLFLPCSVFGFALCPYLDLTFHRARYSTTPGTGVGAFFFGFGVVFCSMIVFSTCYGGQLIPTIEGQPDRTLAKPWAVVLALHLCLQAGFTITVHVRESTQAPKAKTRLLASISALALLMGLATRVEGWPKATLTGGLTWGEAGYRGFLLLYGTVLPAYVWLMMIPRLRGPVPNAGRLVQQVIYAATCFSTYILAWVAFVQGQSTAILFIIGIVVIARILIELLPGQKRVA